MQTRLQNCKMSVEALEIKLAAIQTIEKRRTYEKKVDYPKHPTPKKQGFQKETGRVGCLKWSVRDRTMSWEG